MQARIADMVHPIFRHVLAVHDRLDAGEARGKGITNA